MILETPKSIKSWISNAMKKVTKFMAMKSTKMKWLASYLSSAKSTTRNGATDGIYCQKRPHGTATLGVVTTKLRRDFCQLKKMMKKCIGRNSSGALIRILGSTI